MPAVAPLGEGRLYHFLPDPPPGPPKATRHGAPRPDPRTGAHPDPRTRSRTTRARKSARPIHPPPDAAPLDKGRLYSQRDPHPGPPGATRPVAPRPGAPDQRDPRARPNPRVQPYTTSTPHGPRSIYISRRAHLSIPPLPKEAGREPRGPTGTGQNPAERLVKVPSRNFLVGERGHEDGGSDLGLLEAGDLGEVEEHLVEELRHRGDAHAPGLTLNARARKDMSR